MQSFFQIKKRLHLQKYKSNNSFKKLEIISTLLSRIGIPRPTAPPPLASLFV